MSFVELPPQGRGGNLPIDKALITTPMSEPQIYVAPSDPSLNSTMCPQSGRDEILTLTVFENGRGPEHTEVARFTFAKAPADCPPRTRWLIKNERKLTNNPANKARHRASGVPTIARLQSVEFALSPCEISVPYMLEFVVAKLAGNWGNFHQQILRFVEMPSAYSPIALAELCEGLSDSWKLLASDGSEVGKGPDGIDPESTVAMLLRPIGQNVLSRLPPVRNTPRKTAPKLNRNAFIHCRKGSLGELYQSLDQFSKFDPRRKKANVYPAASLLTLICLARYAGAKSDQNIAELAKSLTKDQREEIGLGKKVGTGGAQGSEKIPARYVFTDFVRAVLSDSRSELEPDLYSKLFGESRSETVEDLPVMDESRILAIFEAWLASNRMKAFKEEFSLWGAPRADRKCKS